MTHLRSYLGGFAVASLAVVTPPLFAEADADATATDEVAVSSIEPSKVFDSLVVTGGAEAVEQIPGSATYLSAELLDEHDYGDLHRSLRLAPGVNIQEEEGFGLRPNIGMRGTGVERSSKITLLEDGVLAAPAPYAAPSAYYVPTAGRMEALEIRKGSASITQGPFTNGGVINLVSQGIPDSFNADVSLAYGDHETWRADALIGNSGDRFGWLLQTYQFDTDGFKDLDGGGSTGAELSDYLGKLRFGSRTDADVYQATEIKLGTTEQFGDETYLGLTRADFGRTPYRRYAGSQQDYIDTDHDQFQVRYFVQPTSRFHLTATVYRNEFYRNWHKGQSVAGVGLSEVVDNPEIYPIELAILRGEIDDESGAIRIRNNRREYLSEGIDLTARVDLRLGKVSHDVEIGVRIHEDSEDRFQEEDRWSMIGGRMVGEVLGSPGSQSNRISSADATAFFVQDVIQLGRWSISPGVRFESIDFAREDFGKSDPTRAGAGLVVKENSTDEVLPGLGLSYAANGEWSLFGGVHKGFAPPGPGQSDEVRNEESVNYEAGFNFRGRELGARVVAFFNDYDNLLGRDTLSSGGEGTGDAFNGGEVEVKGLEASLDRDFGRGGKTLVPVRLIYTYTSTEFRNDFETDFADWEPAVVAGDGLPYIPEQQLTLTAGYAREKWSANLALNYQSEMRTTSGQGPVPSESAIEDRVLADLSLDYEVLSGLKIFAQVRNLTDEIYLVARRPHGARPGLPRTTLLGIRWAAR